MKLLRELLTTLVEMRIGRSYVPVNTSFITKEGRRKRAATHGKIDAAESDSDKLVAVIKSKDRISSVKIAFNVPFYKNRKFFLYEYSSDDGTVYLTTNRGSGTRTLTLIQYSVADVVYEGREAGSSPSTYTHKFRFDGPGTVISTPNPRYDPAVTDRMVSTSRAGRIAKDQQPK